MATEKKIVDIDIEGAGREKFRINGDDNLILELNTTDMGILDRLENGYQKLNDYTKQVAQFEEDDEHSLSEFLKQTDIKMREIVDYIFDSNVSETCCAGGTMLDPKNGMYRFEHIINALTNLYKNNINSEYQKMRARVKSQTDKYIPQDHKPKALSKSQKRRIEIQKDDE